MINRHSAIKVKSPAKIKPVSLPEFCLCGTMRISVANCSCPSCASWLIFPALMNDERKSLEQREQMTDLERLRHSASHVLANAILKIWPEAQFAAGPPVMRTGNIGAFKLTNVASAYYKGDEANPQLQRIYGTAFKTKKELDDYFAMLEEAKKRDHRKLGRELELFVFAPDDVGKGLP